MKNSQTVQQITDSMQQRAEACTTAQDVGQGTEIATAATSITDSQTVSSMSTETSERSRTDDEVSNFKDFQEPGTAWQDDEHEYETQMKLLNEEWKRPEVNAIMTKLLKTELSFAEAADRISVILGHEVTIASVRNRTLHCSELSQSRQTNNQDEVKDDGENGENTVEKDPPVSKELVFGPGLYEVIRNLRGNLSSIAIKEQQSDCVRIYRRSTTRNYYSYYRCSSCDYLSRREVQDGHPSPIIKMVHDSIVGEPFPSHHPECKPVPLSQLRAMQMHRESRQEVMDEMLTPFEAWSRGHLRALLEEARKASQLSRQHPQWKKVKCKSRNENERHPYVRPCGETLISYEEKIRQRLHGQLKRPNSRASSVVSERYGAQTPTDDERSFERRRRDSSTFITDESQSLISDLTEVPDADGLLSEERAQIEQSRVAMEDGSELNETGKVSFASSDSGEPVNDFDGVNQTVFSDQTPTNETKTDPAASSISTGISKVCARDDLSNRVPILKDGAERDTIKGTNRKLFVVDDEHLLKLFQRCPDCGEQLKSLSLSSRRAVPMITYKCEGSCEEKVWFGHESE
uniref:RYYR-CCHC domain-containing protein n=1 Tax=Wuchereria bancrofti TaxID=6293 RepID=A0A1I8ER44_WUCBA